MSAPEAVQEEAAPRLFAATVATPFVATQGNRLSLLWAAAVASTLDRIRLGEGALLAVNVSLIAYQGAPPLHAVIQAVISVLVIGLMYAFNDLYDAPTDWNNPKKDRTLVATWVEHRRVGTLAILGLKVVALVVAFVLLGPRAGAAVAGVMVFNVVYSVALKGVPVIDVAWCGMWGVLYAAIVGAPVSLLVVVGLMTAVCHLFQALGDRVSDAAAGITTTAVRSRVLSRNVLLALCSLLFLALRGPLGIAALTSFTPLALFFAMANPRSGWLLTKVYFGVMWLCLLGVSGAAG